MDSAKICPLIYVTVFLCALAGCKKDTKEKDSIAEQYVVTTFAGNGQGGYVDGPGTTAQFLSLTDITIDAQDNLYVLDQGNYAVRKVSTSGAVSTLAGGGGRDYVNGQGSQARFFFPQSITADAQGNIYVADAYTIRKITPAGETTTLAGKAHESGTTDGVGAAARFEYIWSMTTDRQGNIYAVDENTGVTDPRRIRKITPSGEVSTFSTDVWMGSMIWTDRNGTLYAVTSLAGDHIAKYNAAGEKSFFRSIPEYILGIATDQQGSFYFTQGGVFTFSNEGKVFRLDAAGTIMSIAGKSEPGFADGRGDVAQFDFPGKLQMDSQGNIYVLDHGNLRIRKISKR